MIEPLINHWTIEHLLFGLVIGLTIFILGNSKHRYLLISSFIIILWELFEYRNSPSYWITNYANNLVDIFVGLIGILLIKIITNKFKPKDK